MAKLKKSCKKCYYWTGEGGIGKAYKCYAGDCPAKARDIKDKNNKIAERIRRDSVARMEKQAERLLAHLKD